MKILLHIIGEFTLLRWFFTLLRRGFAFLGKGFTFMKIILSSCYWEFHSFEKGVHYLEREVTLMKNAK